MARPIIAITGPERGAKGPRTLVSWIVRWYGAVPLQIRPSQANRKFVFHGLVVTGGHDVNPVLYAAKPEVEPKYDDNRDALEMKLIREALKREVPILGICRGAQLMNVVRGGDLFQELKSKRANTSNRWTVLPLKTLLLEECTMLERIMGPGRARINSLHNQGISRTGEGLRVSGRDLDNIVQAVEDPAYGYLIGVQWHPEFLLFMGRQRALFRRLIKHARRMADSANDRNASRAGVPR